MVILANGNKVANGNCCQLLRAPFKIRVHKIIHPRQYQKCSCYMQFTQDIFQICETPKPSKRRESAQICPIIENQALRKRSRWSQSPNKNFNSKEQLKSSETAKSLDKREGTIRYAEKFHDGNSPQKSPKFNDSRVSETEIPSKKIQKNFSRSKTTAISKEKEDLVKSLNDDTKNRNSYEKRKEIKSNNLQNQTVKINSRNDDEQTDQENCSPIIESKYFKSNRVNISSSISSLLSSSNTSNDTVNGDKSMSSLEKHWINMN